MSARNTQVRSFDTQHGRGTHSVRVETDPDLSVKFARGGVVRGDDGSIYAAIVYGIDEMESSRIDIDESSLSLRERLECIKSAVDLALDGCPE